MSSGRQANPSYFAGNGTLDMPLMADKPSSDDNALEAVPQCIQQQQQLLLLQQNGANTREVAAQAPSPQTVVKDEASTSPKRSIHDDVRKGCPDAGEDPRKPPPAARHFCDNNAFPVCVHLTGQWEVHPHAHARCSLASHEDFLFPDLRLIDEDDDVVFSRAADGRPPEVKDTLRGSAPAPDAEGPQYTYPQVVVMHPTKIRWRESSPAASTTFAFLVGLLTTVVCAWPCGIIAVIAAKRARDSVAIGDFTRARRLVQNALIYSALSLIFGLIMWLVICWRTDVIVHSAFRHDIADFH